MELWSSAAWGRGEERGGIRRREMQGRGGKSREGEGKGKEGRRKKTA